jgi:hypothetical protein
MHRTPKEKFHFILYFDYFLFIYHFADYPTFRLAALPLPDLPDHGEGTTLQYSLNIPAAQLIHFSLHETHTCS